MSSAERTQQSQPGAGPTASTAAAADHAVTRRLPGVHGPVDEGARLGGRYRIGRRVGAGGMATIYRAFDETLERPVAVKILHPHLAHDAALRAHLQSEARHAALLTDPHVVAVYDHGMEGLPYIIMELVDGPSLREVLTARVRLSAAEVLTVVEPVARALARAHDRGLVHRDIKPENLLITEGGLVKVADFGIARAMAATSHTQAGTLLGSVHYLAPELVDGQVATPASDQYSVGVMLYELLTGRQPFTGDTPMAVALRHARSRVQAPSRMGADCGPAVDAVVVRATDHHPARRYPDLEALAAALRDAVPDGPAPEVLATLPRVSDSHSTRTVHGQTAALPRPAAVSPSASPVAAPPWAPHSHVDGRAPGQNHGRTHLAARTTRWLRQPRRPLLTALVSLLLVGAAWGGAALAWWSYVLAPVTAVPELVGMSQDAAFDAADDRGLGFSVEGGRHDLDAPEGQVLDQEPAPGSELRRGDDIAVVVSRGPEPAVMPEILGAHEVQRR